MFGPYLMLQTLGEGEFGKVKLGIHIETEQEVNVSDSFNPQSSRQL
jgi:serine/threonine protein kinase